MKRNKKIIVVCHCLLNCNSKVEGLSLFEGVHDIVLNKIKEGYGIIQLPCPEMIMYGIKRWGHVKNQFDTPFFRKQCRLMLDSYILQFKNYLKNGYTIEKIISVDYSPSCGYNKTCISEDWCGSFSQIKQIPKTEIKDEKGVFIEELEKLLKENNLQIPIEGLDEKKYLEKFNK